MAAPNSGPSEPLWTRAFVTLAVAELAYFTAFGVLIPIVPLYVVIGLGGSEAEAGIAVGALAVTALVLRPLAGRTADRRGRRPLLIGGGLLFGVVTAAHLLATDVLVLIGLRLLLGVAEAFFFVAGFTMLADLAPRGRAGEAVSFNSLALYLGIALGPLLGELLLESIGYEAAFLGSAALALAAGLLSIALPERWVPDPDAEAPPLLHRRAVAPSAALFMGVTAMAGFLLLVVLDVEDVGLDSTGLPLLVFGMTVVLSRIVLARVPDRVPPYRLATIALGLVSLGLVAAALLRMPLGLLAAAVVIGVGVALLTPAIFTALLARVTPADRGAAMGTMTIFLDLAFGGGPILLGFVASAAGIPAAYLVAAAVALIGAAGTAISAVAMSRRGAVAA